MSSLQLYLGECEAVTFRTNDGGTIAGRELIERFWSGLVQWATVDQPAIAAEVQRQLLHARVMRHPDGAEIWREFEAAG